MPKILFMTLRIEVAVPYKTYREDPDFHEDLPRDVFDQLPQFGDGTEGNDLYDYDVEPIEHKPLHTLVILKIKP